mgnify:CR=1 FL=1
MRRPKCFHYILENDSRLIARHFCDTAVRNLEVILLTVRSFYLRFPRLKFRDERLMTGEHRKDSFRSRKNNRYRITIEEVLSDARDCEMKVLRCHVLS